MPQPAGLLVPAGSINLLAQGLTTIVPASSGWITTAAFLIADSADGAQLTGATIRIGSAGTYDEVVAAVNLGTTMVVGELVILTLVTPMVSLSGVVALQVDTAATGPTAISASVYLQGFFR